MQHDASPVFTNISATTAAFALIGGLYAVDIVATWSAGSVTFQKLAPDGSTWIAVNAFTANDSETYYLSAGSYRFSVVTATAVYAIATRIPQG